MKYSGCFTRKLDDTPEQAVVVWNGFADSRGKRTCEITEVRWYGQDITNSLADEEMHELHEIAERMMPSHQEVIDDYINDGFERANWAAKCTDVVEVGK